MEEQPKKQPKSVIPKKAQAPLVIFGLLLLAYFSYDTANKMGWVGKPPKAKTPVAAKHTPEPAGGGGATAPTPAPTPPAGTSRPSTGAATRPGSAPVDLDTLKAPARDPMGNLGAPAAPPVRPQNVPPAPGAAPPAPGRGAEPPPLPPPVMPPGGTPGSFPSPITGPGAPPAVPAAAVPIAPAFRPAPAAFTVNYPLARRGPKPQAAPAVTLMGTISGNRGSMAVVHPGDTARGQYVRPGESLPGNAVRVESIKPGKVTLGGRGGSREVLLRPRPPAEAPAKTETTPDASATTPKP